MKFQERFVFKSIQILDFLATKESLQDHKSLKLLFIFKSVAICAFLCALTACQLPAFLSGGKSISGGISKNPCVVLALPANGPYAPFAQKIIKGADMAKQELAANGINLTLENVNTEAPDWIKTLDALPQVCAVVGGPLQNNAYVQARKSGALERRVFFSFVPTIQEGDEGSRAWRFFPSPQDQIDTLVKFVADDLNIHTFASFYPQDSYGPRMTDLLEKKLSTRHIPLQKAFYNPAAPASWSGAIKPLINPVYAGSRKTPIPQTTFEALFLPDSWKRMDMISTSLMYNGEDRLALLGTTLWEQGLSGKQVPKAQRYALAIFPGAYSKDRAPKKIQEQGNDFWIALGYDFINFAVNTGIASRLESVDINGRANSAAGSIRAMAPINWDSAGHAHQNLYLFQIGPNGAVPLNIDQYKQSRTAILEQAALRMQGARQEAAQSEPDLDAVPVSQEMTSSGINQEAALPPEESPAITTPESVTPVHSAPVIPQNQIMRSSPQPSYKLHLPNRP